MLGETVGHYRIDAELGAGGMGVVYRAYDTRLERTVAIKLLRADVDETSRARLLHEARAASALNHPNICTIHEVEETGGRAFIVMECVEGQPLRVRASGEGLPPATVVRYGVQIADALAHAHVRGVVHCDLKSANIIVLPDGRVKVLDFGVARRIPDADRDAATRSLTTVGDAGALGGTPAYMAPEVLRGAPADARSDVWGLGIVLYEMACGDVPFHGRTWFDLTGAILHDPTPAMPARVPPWLRSVISRCLEKDPAQRYQRAGEVRAAIEAGQFHAEANRPGRTALIVGAALVLLLVLAGALADRLFTRRPPEVASAPPGPTAVSPTPRRAVAVLGFKNLSGREEVAWISTALAEMLTTELAAGEKLRMIPGENVARMKIDLALAEADGYARDTLARIRANLGTDLVVSGSYVAVSQKIRFDMRLQDAGAGETLAAVAESGDEADLISLVARMGARLRDRLGVAELSAAEADGARAAQPSTAEAARLYAEGLARLRLFDAPGARTLLERAVGVDPDLPLAHSALAAAWSALGHDDQARAEAQRAFELSSKLAREERLWVEGGYRESINDWARAVEIYQTLADFFPDNLDYGLRLAGAQVAWGKGQEALATIETLRRLPPPLSEDPRLDLAEASAAESLSDLKRQQAAAARAASRGAAQGARRLVASARLSECSALNALGDAENAANACAEAQRIFAEAGDRGGSARAVNAAAIVLRRRGDMSGAVRMYRQALATYREIGNRRSTADVLNNLGNVLRQQGDFAGARALYAESLAIAREIGDKSGAAQVLNATAIVLRQQGDMRAALENYREALAIRRDIGERSSVAATLNNIANVLSDQGDLAGAREMYEEALATSREIGDAGMVAMALSNLAVMRWQQGELAPAQSGYEESLAVSRASNDRQGIARGLTNLADLLARRGNLDDARRMYEDAMSIWTEMGEKRGLGFALSGLGQVLRAQGDLTGARTRHEEALAVREQTGQKGTAEESRVALAELAVDEGRPADAEPLVRNAMAMFRAERMLQSEIAAEDVLARSYLAQRRLGDARRTVDRAGELSRRVQNRHVRLALAVTDARVRAATGQPAEAVRRLEAALAETRAIGFVDLELEARLALGELDLASNRVAAGRARLKEVEEEAARRGFLLVARRAAAAG